MFRRPFDRKTALLRATSSGKVKCEVRCAGSTRLSPTLATHWHRTTE